MLRVGGTNMNLRRGLFRLWILFSVLFVATTLIVAAISFRVELADAAFVGSSDDPYAGISEPANPPAPWTHLAIFILVAAGVPAAVLGCGLAMSWAASGFRRQ